MKRLLMTVALFAALLFFFVACGNSSPNSNHPGAHLNDDDDDASPDDDDNDNDDNDNDDNDDNDDISPSGQAFSPFQTIPYLNEPDIQIEMIAGGAPGHYGIGAAQIAGGAIAIAAVKGRTLMIYYLHPDQTLTEDAVAQNAAFPTLAPGPNGGVHVLDLDPIRNMLVYVDKGGDGTWQFADAAPYPFTEYVSFAPPYALAVDAGGTAHAAFITPDYRQVRYATNVAGAWSTELIDALDGSQTFDPPSLAVSADGVVHVAFDDLGASLGLVYAERTTAGWTTQQLLPGAEFPLRPNLALDSQQQPNIAVSVRPNSSQTSEMLLTRTAEGWTSTTSDFSTDTSAQRMIFVNGAPEIVALDGANDRIVLYTPGVSAWQQEIMVDTPAAGYIAYVDVAQDPSGQPVTAYYTAYPWSYPPVPAAPTAGAGLAYVANRGNAWVSTPIEPGDAAASYNPAVVVDDSGAAHVVFSFDEGTAWLGANAGGWQFQSLEDGVGASAAIDATQRLHVSLWRPTTQHLAYWTDAGGSWAVEDIPIVVDDPTWGTPLAFLNTAIALDSQGQPGIAACTGLGMSDGLGFSSGAGVLGLRSATQGWTQAYVFPVDVSAAATNISLAFNGDKPRLAYYDVDGFFNLGNGRWQYMGSLMYLSFAAGWVTEQVTANEYGWPTGWAPAVAVDSSGEEYLSYSIGEPVLQQGHILSWSQPQTVSRLPDGLPLFGGYAALTLDEVGGPVLAFDSITGNYNLGMALAWRGADGWRSKVVDSGGGPYGVAIAPDGWAHVVYCSDGAVWHARISRNYLKNKVSR